MTFNITYRFRLQVVHPCKVEVSSYIHFTITVNGHAPTSFSRLSIPKMCPHFISQQKISTHDDIIEGILYHIIDESFRIHSKIDGLKTFFFGQRYDGRYSHVVSC